MSFDLLDNYSLDQQANFPKRTLPIGFMLRLAKALHSYGMTAYELEGTMKKIGTKLGFGVQCLSQPTNLILSFSHPDEPEPKTYIFRVDPGEVYLERQVLVEEVVQAVTDDSMNVEEAAKRLKQIALSPLRFGDAGIIAGYGLLSGAIARVLGGAVNEILLALCIGLLTGLLALRLKKQDTAKFLFPTLAAMLSAAVASLVSSFGLLASPYIATLSGVIVLIPGLLLTTAIAELARQDMVSGTARFFSAVTVFLQIAFGVVIGNSLGAIFPSEPITLQLLLPEWTRWVAILVAGSGLFFLFQSRPKDFPWVLLGGFIAYGVTAFGSQHLGPVLGAFVGALATGLASNLFERLTNVPRAVMLMPGIILLVPGSIGFQSLSFLVESNVIEGMNTAFIMSFVSIALVTGLLIASLIIPPNTRQ
jgi:uncharacterized membrane protein YjjP (DUF1212 family)